MPEFLRIRLNGLTFRHLAVGLSIFAIGLFKKAVIADNVSCSVGPVFNAAAQGVQVTFFEAWGGMLAYTAQLYFDFSGYSDMAIGLALFACVCRSIFSRRISRVISLSFGSVGISPSVVFCAIICISRWAEIEKENSIATAIYF
ncbi:MAG: hypothetical protein R3E67_08365 [Pseudomonadales bacterium]